jgi:hypothetical protein
MQPRIAPEVGIGSPERWPYGPHDDPSCRIAMRDWAARHGLRLADNRGTRCRHWLLARSCDDHRRAEWEDHVSRWTRGGQRAVVIGQPYPGSFDDAEVRRFAHAHGLLAHIDPDSGWYGHGTVFVAVFDPSVIDKVDALPRVVHDEN